MEPLVLYSDNGSPQSSPNSPTSELSPKKNEKTGAKSTAANIEDSQVPKPPPKVVAEIQNPHTITDEKASDKKSTKKSRWDKPPEPFKTAATASSSSVATLHSEQNEMVLPTSTSTSSLSAAVRRDLKQENSNPASSMTVKRKFSSSSGNASTIVSSSSVSTLHSKQKERDVNINSTASISSTAEDKQQNKPKTSAINSALTPKRRNRWDVEPDQASSTDSSYAASASDAVVSMPATGSEGILGQRTANVDDENPKSGSSLEGNSLNQLPFYLAHAGFQKPVFGGDGIPEDIRRTILKDVEKDKKLEASREEKNKILSKGFDTSKAMYQGYTFNFNAAVQGSSAKRHIESHVEKNKGKFPMGFNSFAELKKSLLKACVDAIDRGELGRVGYNTKVSIFRDGLNWNLILKKDKTSQNTYSIVHADINSFY